MNDQPVQLTNPPHPHDEEASIELTTPIGDASIEMSNWPMISVVLIVAIAVVLIFRRR